MQDDSFKVRTKMKYITVIILLSLSMLLGCKEDSSTNPQTEVIHGLYFTPDEATVAIGQEVALNINVGELVDSVFAVSFQLAYKDSAIQFPDSLGIQAGTFLGVDAVQFAYDSASTMYVTLSRIQGQSEVSGSGVLCTLKLKGKAAGISPIEFLSDKLQFYNSQGSEIEQTDLEIHAATLHVQ
jgi:hypothetical protein